MNQCSTKLCSCVGGNGKFVVDLSNFAIKPTKMQQV